MPTPSDLQTWCGTLPASDVAAVVSVTHERERVYLQDGRVWQTQGYKNGDHLGPGIPLSAHWLEPIPGTMAGKLWAAYLTNSDDARNESIAASVRAEAERKRLWPGGYPGPDATS